MVMRRLTGGVVAVVVMVGGLLGGAVPAQASGKANTAQVCVVDSKGNPVPAIVVELDEWSDGVWDWVDDNSTDSAGCVTFTLPSDASHFAVEANADTDDVRVGSGSLDGLTDLPSDGTGAGVRTQPAARGAALTWGTIVVPSLNQVTGVVVDDLGTPVEGAEMPGAPGKALEGATVVALGWDPDEGGWESLLSIGVATEGGRFTIGVPQGVTYTLQASAGGYMDGWLGNEGEPASAGPSAGTRVSPSVVTDSPTDLSSSPIVVRRLAEVSGTVVDLDGQPVPDAAITLVTWDPADDRIVDRNPEEADLDEDDLDEDVPEGACDTTDDDGSFTCPVAPGERYTVQAQQDDYADGWLGNKGEPADAGASTVQPALEPGVSQTIDAIVLGRPNSAHICVTDSKGDPASTTIDLYGWDGEWWTWITETDTDATGCGTIPLPSDTTVFTARAEADGVNASAYVDGLAQPPSTNSGTGTRTQPADEGPTSGGQTLNWTIAMPEGDSVTGVVVDDIGEPVPNVSVILYLWDPDGQEWGDVAGVEANAQGEFSIGGIPASAAYTLYASADDDHYLDGWAGNQEKPESDRSVGASIAPPTVGTTTALPQPIILSRLIQLSGTVVTPGGKPYPGGPSADMDGSLSDEMGASVTVYVWQDGQWMWYDQEETAIDASAGEVGAYAISVPAGSRAIVEADPASGDAAYATGWSGDLAVGPVNPTGPGVITVTNASGATSQKLAPVALQNRATTISLVASGRVVDGNGKPVVGVKVDASNDPACENGCLREQRWGPATTDSNGLYTIRKISTGAPYLIRAQSWAASDSALKAFGFPGKPDLSCGAGIDDIEDLNSDGAETVWGNQPRLSDIILRTYIIFDGNGGHMSPKSTDFGACPALNAAIGPLPTDVSRDGYVLAGWNTKANGKGKAVTASTLALRPMTAYAQWKPEKPQSPQEPSPLISSPLILAADGSIATASGSTDGTPIPAPQLQGQTLLHDSPADLSIAIWLLALAAALLCWRTVRIRRSSRAER